MRVPAHFGDEDRQGQRPGEQGHAAGMGDLCGAARSSGIGRVFLGRAGRVAGLRDDAGEVGGRGGARQVGDLRRLGREVDGGGQHAGGCRQAVLDPAHAGGAMHAVNREGRLRRAGRIARRGERAGDGVERRGAGVYLRGAGGEVHGCGVHARQGRERAFGAARAAGAGHAVNL